MLFQIYLGVFFSISLVSASPVLQARDTCGESESLVCYGPNHDMGSQNLDIRDIKYVAKALRNHFRFGGRNTSTVALRWTAPADDDSDCAEWTLPVPYSQTVSVKAKHVNPLLESWFLYEDIAYAIDGGEDASEAEKARSLLSCGSNGGQIGLGVNKRGPVQHTSDLDADDKGVIIKLVKNPQADSWP
ncbi:hypothetical protein CDD82_1038 [Ophiocordyceps australis]|uniref:Ecp2 effector protein domain-containing protein n=1 Tax=Ophiocordyceps australis TaxID=1399860 RepID=A0A2C5YJU0_9HYPO|nr:hypothetical protein CDD82_1038 [Ophiocordyceps australis]